MRALLFLPFGQGAPWPRYKKLGDITTADGDVTRTDDEPGNDIGEYVASTHVVSAEAFYGLEYSRNYWGGVFPENEDCPFWPDLDPVESCTSEGTSTYTAYDWKFWGVLPPFNQDYAASYTWTETIASAEGDTTVEFLAWRVLYPTDGDYETAVTAYAVYQAEYQVWIDNQPNPEDYENPEDYDAAVLAWEATEPDPVDEPTARPEEFYGPCQFKIIFTITIFDHYFGKNSDGSSAVPASPPADSVQDWVDGGQIGDAPTTGTGTKTTYTGDETQTFSALAKPVGTTIVSLTGQYTEPVEKEDWDDEVAQIIDGALSCGLDDACYVDVCVAATAILSLSFVANQVCYRWVIPTDGTMNDPRKTLPDPLPEGYEDADAWWADNQIPKPYQGTYFKVTWDVLTEPDGWDDTINDPNETLPDPLPEGYDTADEWWADHQVPKPGRPTRTYLQDLTWEWTGPADPLNPESWKSPEYVLKRPPEAGNRRVVNIRYECYRSPYGNKPEVTGEGVDLDDDIPLQRRLISDRHSIKLPSITI
jgi:hypothetical protein